MTTEEIRQAILRKHPDALIGEEVFGVPGNLLISVTLPRKGLRHCTTVYSVGAMKKALTECAKKLNVEIK